MSCATRATPPAAATRARRATARPSPSAVAGARRPRPAVRWTTAARVASRHFSARGGVVAASAETRGVVRASRGAHARDDGRGALVAATPTRGEGARDGDGGDGGDGGDRGGGDDEDDEDDAGDDDDDDGRVRVFSLVALAAPSEGDAVFDAAGDTIVSDDDDDEAKEAGREKKVTAKELTVSVVIPALNEAATIERVLSRLATLEPKAREVIVCVGDSTDDTEAIVSRFVSRTNTNVNVKVVRSNRGRSKQMNAGAAIATGDVFLFLHADTLVPSDVVAVVRRAMRRDARVVCGGFVSLIETRTKTYWGMSLHNVLKTYYTPLLVKPLSFARGLRCLFGDQAMFADAACFRSVSGFDEALPIMEDADLCLRLHESGWVRGSNGVAARTGGNGDGTREGSGATETAMRDERFVSANAVPALTCAGKWEDVEDENDAQSEKKKKKRKRFRKTTLAPKAAGSNLGRIVLVNRVVTTSGRRIEGLGNLKATLTHFLIGVSWYCGADPDAMAALYRKFYPPANP